MRRTGGGPILPARWTKTIQDAASELLRIPVPRTWVHKPILRFCDLRPWWRKLFWHMSDGENHKERLNRELIELLNELRVALPGVQVLFAFLLIVPFSQ
jgi:hypothetical protein